MANDHGVKAQELVGLAQRTSVIDPLRDWEYSFSHGNSLARLHWNQSILMRAGGELELEIYPHSKYDPMLHSFDRFTIGRITTGRILPPESKRKYTKNKEFSSLTLKA